VDSLDYRFNGKPWMTKPASPTAANYQQILTREMALTTPFLFRGCTQFMVEFAGDFITQDNDPTSLSYGKFLAAKPDGVLDFYRDGNKVRRTRWYGFPRDTSSSTGTALPANNGAPDGHITSSYDVVPVRDVAGTQMSFEKVLPTAGAVDYGRLNPGALGPNAQYICAWGPNELNPTTGNSSRPWMIRLVLQLTDQNGRLGDGQVVEYVYTLPKY
jgi:hypothetical protein